MPEGAKLVEIARLFGVSIDYLLREDITDPAFPHTAYEAPCWDVGSMEEAQDYLHAAKRLAHRVSGGFFLCMLSPIVLLYLLALSLYTANSGISEQEATGIGMCVLFLIVMVGGTWLFVSLFRFPYRHWMRRDVAIHPQIKEELLSLQKRKLHALIIRLLFCLLLVACSIGAFLYVCLQYQESAETIFAVIGMLAGLGAGIGIAINTGMQALCFYHLLNGHLHQTPYGAPRGERLK